MISQLSDVKQFGDFKLLYESNNLVNQEDKIAFLIEHLGILSIQCNREESGDEKLLDLEEYVLTHPWQCK